MAQALQSLRVLPTLYSLNFRVHTRVFVSLFVAILIMVTVWRATLLTDPVQKVTAAKATIALRVLDDGKEKEPRLFSIPFTIQFFFFP